MFEVEKRVLEDMENVIYYSQYFNYIDKDKVKESIKLLKKACKLIKNGESEKVIKSEE